VEPATDPKVRRQSYLSAAPSARVNLTLDSARAGAFRRGNPSDNTAPAQDTKPPLPLHRHQNNRGTCPCRSPGCPIYRTPTQKGRCDFLGGGHARLSGEANPPNGSDLTFQGNSGLQTPPQQVSVSAGTGDAQRHQQKRIRPCRAAAAALERPAGGLIPQRLGSGDSG